MNGGSTQSISFTIILLLLVLVTSVLYHQKQNASRKTNIISLIVLTGIISISCFAYFHYKPGSIQVIESINITDSVPIHVLSTVVTIILTYMATIAVDSATQKMVQENGKQVVDEHRREVIFRILQLTMYAFVAIGLLNYWNVDIRSILIGAGALAAIIGLSARHTLSAALAGIILLFSRPFKVGDWIEINGTEGTVRRITIVNTILQTPKDEQVVIPNDVIGQTQIKNKNKTNKLRVSVSVEASYEDNTDKVLNVAESSVKNCDIIADVPEPTAHMESFENSGVVIKLYFWIRKPTPRRRTVAIANANKKIKDAFDGNGIEIPYPKRDLTTDNFVIEQDSETHDLQDTKQNKKNEDDTVIVENKSDKT